MIRNVLLRAVDTRDHLDQYLAVQAVAAAALVAPTVPGRRRRHHCIRAGSAPPGALHRLALAVRALDRVVTEPSELIELWDETDGTGPWRATLVRLRTALLSATSEEQPA
ncbi:hypothetical protein B6R96_36505 (plasmid) [Streptomyces sp. Sge12]|uniref:DUF4259 domain-containing protein n=1 Tax=Streptomyces sp. Sge12 TaxID=1972846 RepID=UPI0009C2FA3E|nr:hypothetical protein B6R96_36505 [Streptomyces sp. Sge12]